IRPGPRLPGSVPGVDPGRDARSDRGGGLPLLRPQGIYSGDGGPWVTRVALGFGGNLPVRQAAVVARYAEEHGFESCWVHEAYWNRDALSFLAALAVGTDRVGLATGCINPYTRHPVLVASS